MAKECLTTMLVFQRSATLMPLIQVIEISSTYGKRCCNTCNLNLVTVNDSNVESVKAVTNHGGLGAKNSCSALRLTFPVELNRKFGQYNARSFSTKLTKLTDSCVVLQPDEAGNNVLAQRRKQNRALRPTQDVAHSESACIANDAGISQPVNKFTTAATTVRQAPNPHPFKLSPGTTMGSVKGRSGFRNGDRAMHVVVGCLE